MLNKPECKVPYCSSQLAIILFFYKEDRRDFFKKIFKLGVIWHGFQMPGRV